MNISRKARYLHIAVMALLLALVSSLVFPQAALAAITSSFNPVTGTLTITGDDADNTIEVWASGGKVYVNGYSPDTGELNASQVKSIVVDGGKGNDTLDLSGVTADFSQLFDGNVGIRGESGNDTLIGSALGDQMFGGDGNDWLDGGLGNDWLYGGPGNDLLKSSHGDDTLDGGEGDDTLFSRYHLLNGYDGRHDTRLNLGHTTIMIDLDGNDTLDFSEATTGIIIDLDLQNVDQIVDVAGNTVQLQGQLENFVGSAFDDTLALDPLNVPRGVNGGAGNDTLNFDAKGLAVTDHGTTIILPGYALVTYTGFETVNITRMCYLPLILRSYP